MAYSSLFTFPLFMLNPLCPYFNSYISLPKCPILSQKHCCLPPVEWICLMELKLLILKRTLPLLVPCYH